MATLTAGTTKYFVKDKEIPRLQYGAHTSKECLTFLQQLSYLTTVQILQLRELLPINAFKKVTFEGKTIFLLNLKDNAARNAFDNIKEPLNSISQQLLKRLVISIRKPERQLFENSDDDYGGYADEAFTLKLAYGQNGHVMIVRQSDGMVVDKLKYEGANSIRKATIKLLEAIQQLRQTLQPLPKPMHYYFRVALGQPDIGLDRYRTVTTPQQIADGGYRCLSTMALPRGRILIDVQSTFLKEQRVSNQAALTIQSNPASAVWDEGFTFDETRSRDRSGSITSKFLLDDETRRTLDATRGSRNSTYTQDTLLNISSLQQEFSNGSEGIELPRKDPDTMLLEFGRSKKSDPEMSVSNKAITGASSRKRSVASSLGTYSELPRPHERVARRGHAVMETRQSKRSRTLEVAKALEISVDNFSGSDETEVQASHTESVAISCAITENLQVPPYKIARTSRLDYESDFEP